MVPGVPWDWYQSETLAGFDIDPLAVWIVSAFGRDVPCPDTGPKGREKRNRRKEKRKAKITIWYRESVSVMGPPGTE